MIERPYQSEVQAELAAEAEQRRKECAALLEAEAAQAGVLTDKQLADFRRRMQDKPAPGEAYFPIAVLLMRHIEATESIAEPEATYDCPIHGNLGGINFCPRC